MTLDFEAARELVRRPHVARLLNALAANGEEARVVGGAVRNALIGRPAGDVDVATTTLPRETMSRAAQAGFRTVPTGLEHGTVTVVLDGAAFEVTTLREDVETDGRRAIVRFGRDFSHDAQRRDFTLNALSVGLDGVVRDYAGGLADLEAGRVRFIGEPIERIREDYLRVLRFFRFWAEYGRGAIDPAGLKGAVRGRDGLPRLSRERVRAEFLKLLAAARAVEAAGYLQHTGLLGRLVSGIGDLGRLGRASGAGADPTGRLAAFLVRTAADAERLRDQLRLSNAERDRLLAYAAAAARLASGPAPIDAVEARRLAATFGPAALADAFAALDGEPRPRLTGEGRAALEAFLSGEEEPPLFPLTGADLIRDGVPPGPELGRRLAEARRRWIEAGCPT